MDLNLYLIDEGMLFPAGPGVTWCRGSDAGPERGAPTHIAEIASRQPPPPAGVNMILIVRAYETMQQLTARIWGECGRYRLNMIRICGHGDDTMINFGASLRTDADAQAFRFIRRMWVRPGFGSVTESLARARIEVHGCMSGNLFVLQNVANHAGVPVWAGTRIIDTSGGRVTGMGQEIDDHFAFEGHVRRRASNSPVSPAEFSQL